MVKQITIASGTVFRPLYTANEHFSKLREGTTIGTLLTEPNKSDVLDVYRRYCAATNWKAEDVVDVTVAWENSKRADGTYAQTKAFAIVTASGSSHIFSIDKALAKIAV